MTECVFSSHRLLDSMLEPLALLVGSLLAAQMAETSLTIRLGAAQSRPRAHFERIRRPPIAFQEAFKTLAATIGHLR